MRMGKKKRPKIKYGGQKNDFVLTILGSFSN